MVITLDEKELKSLIQETVLELFADREGRFGELVAEVVEDTLLLKILRETPTGDTLSYQEFLQEVNAE
ncbi:MAG: hypothetical protein AAFZ52_10145 [Bacteroidota bacterium]